LGCQEFEVPKTSSGVQVGTGPRFGVETFAWTVEYTWIRERYFMLFEVFKDKSPKAVL